MKNNFYIPNKLIKKFSSILTTTLLIHFRIKGMIVSCEYYLKTSEFMSTNQRVVIIATTINNSLSFFLKNGSCKPCDRLKNGFSLKLDKRMDHTILGDLTIV